MIPHTALQEAGSASALWPWLHSPAGEDGSQAARIVITPGQESKTPTARGRFRDGRPASSGAREKLPSLRRFLHCGAPYKWRTVLSLSGLNWLAIIVAAIVFFGLAAIWYQPKVMGKRWMEAAGVDPSSDGPKPVFFVATFVAYLVMATVLAMIARGTGASSFGEGLVLGLLTGVAFVALQAMVNAIAEGRSRWIVRANGGIGIIGHTVMAVIVTTWA